MSMVGTNQNAPQNSLQNHSIQIFGLLATGLLVPLYWWSSEHRTLHSIWDGKPSLSLNGSKGCPQITNTDRAMNQVNGTILYLALPVEDEDKEWSNDEELKVIRQIPSQTYTL